VSDRTTQTSVRTAFFDLLERHSWIESREPAAVLTGILKIYLDPAGDSPWRNLCEHLMRFDELVSLWRYRHVQMVERMIGMKPGTGGSLGVAYLKTTLRKRFFPELWEARTQMGTTY
jgi:tryptophan 2,3-dioxygenase